MSDKTFGIILSGAGHLDGSEISEAVLCLLALDEAGVAVRAFAPDVSLDELDHVAAKATGERRGVIAESARIVRGQIEDLAVVSGTEVDGWVLPGGGGVVKNLSDYAEAGVGAIPHKEVARVVKEALAAQLPVAACCMAPVLLALITKRSGPQLKLTAGADGDVAKALRAMGAEHAECGIDDVVVDEQHHVVTTPAYMIPGARLARVRGGIEKMVQQVVDWA